MTDHDQQQAAADVQGMIEAAQRHSGGMSQVEVAQQYRAIQARPVSPVTPFVSQPEQPKDLTPIAVGAAKVVGAVAVVAIMGKVFVVGVTTVFLIIEANAMYAVAAVVGGVALIGLRAGMSGGNELGSTGSHNGHSRGGNCGCRGTTIIQNNNFGGQSAEQNNRR